MNKPAFYKIEMWILSLTPKPVQLSFYSEMINAVTLQILQICFPRQ